VHVDAREVLVRETADGELAIEVSDRSYRMRTHGLLPTDDIPIGTAEWNEQVLVASVGPTVKCVRVTLTDGTILEPELHGVDNSAAQYVIVPLSAGVQPKRLVVLDAAGAELATDDYRLIGSIRQQRNVP
jgi:hypothetical protein